MNKLQYDTSIVYMYSIRFARAPKFKKVNGMTMTCKPIGYDINAYTSKKFMHARFTVKLSLD